MSIHSELCALKRKSGVLLKIETAYAWAKAHPKSKLHGALEWDDRIAGERYRLQQIGELIRVHCVDVEGVRTLVSLSVDRVQGGGFRSMEDVVSDKKLREVLLADALADLKKFEERYQLIKDLVSGVRKIRKRMEQTQTKGGAKKRAA